ncbi:MAG: hypothetical protein HY658_10345 [Actinobacteria bacterium]|nr:hypothetical protein [Actinomycetota bacterium]
MELERERARPEPGASLLIAGIALALVGVAGDLVWHGMHPDDHARLLALDSGEAPWHVLLMLGISIATVGGVRWAVGRRSEAGRFLGAGLSLLLLLTAGAAAWATAVGGGPGDVGTAQPAGGSRAVAAAPGHGHSGTGAAVASDPAAGAAGQASSGGGSGGGGAIHGQHAEAVPNTADEQAQVDAMLAQAKRATRKYRDLERARADGYIQVTQFIPGLGAHWFNPRIGPVFDPSRPQILLYEPNARGVPKLVGVAYRLPHTSDDPPAGFPGGEDVWHYHENLCFLRGGTVTVADEAGCASLGGFHQANTGWMLHAWIYRESPDGVFSDSNPDVG